jgi:hypothetical protein
MRALGEGAFILIVRAEHVTGWDAGGQPPTARERLRHAGGDFGARINQFHRGSEDTLNESSHLILVAPRARDAGKHNGTGLAGRIARWAHTGENAQRLTNSLHM